MRGGEEIPQARRNAISKAIDVGIRVSSKLEPLFWFSWAAQ